MSEAITLIFIGRSGSGKGTQIDLLSSHLKKQHSDRSVLHFSSGNYFRSFITSEGYTQKRVQKFLQEGKLVPNFLSNWIITAAMVDEFTDTNIVIFDGFPRTVEQAQALDEALEFYNRNRVYVIELQVSEEEARTRLQARAREDDAALSVIDERLSWYRREIPTLLDWFAGHDRYQHLQVNGEGDIEAIHQDLVEQFNTLHNAQN